MRFFKVFYVLSSALLVFGSTQAFAQPEEQGFFEIKELPLDQPLTPHIRYLINLYMNYPALIKELPRGVQKNFPLVVALHEQELDQGSLIRYGVYQEVLARMDLEDIAMLHKLMTILQRGQPLTESQKEFLTKFIRVYIKENPSIALIRANAPLFHYIAFYPRAFDERTIRILHNATLEAAGLSTGDIRKLQDLAKIDFDKNPELSEKEITVLQKVVILSRLNRLDSFSSEQLLAFRALILRNAPRFPGVTPDVLQASIEYKAIQKRRAAYQEQPTLKNDEVQPGFGFVPGYQAPKQYQRYPNEQQYPQGTQGFQGHPITPSYNHGYFVDPSSQNGIQQHH